MNTATPQEVLFLKREGGKKITVSAYGNDVVITVWRKNDGVLLPLVLNRMEAQRLASWIKSITDTTPR